MKHATSRALYDYWNRVRGGRSAPERSEMKPDAIARILGDVLMLENSGHAYAFRLAGTQICTLLGRELRGQSFTGIFAAAEQAEIYSLLDPATRAAMPVIVSVVGETEDRRLLGLELLLLPLRHQGRTNTRLIGSLAALSRPYWSSLVPLSALRIGSSRFLRHEDTTPEGLPPGGLFQAVPRLRVVQGGRT